MTARVSNPPKYAGETKTITFDFTGDLASGETISTKTCTSTVYSGTDASPSSLINGSASSSGAVVSQSITAGTVGVIYLVKCTIVTSASQTLIKETLIAVIVDQP